ncbi:hypothetical protein NDU88_001947 [Pleurodeles waltl]|uniref:Uncharacterized protein n=1 Tax=Pleurodeles waltl TaxID=8319 RepID=A0AAV7UW58_PLEWA|nr:hypothetical protein NDU88_001947 [Pleurodeles waltl]
MPSAARGGMGERDSAPPLQQGPRSSTERRAPWQRRGALKGLPHEFRRLFTVEWQFAVRFGVRDRRCCAQLL